MNIKTFKKLKKSESKLFNTFCHLQNQVDFFNKKNTTTDPFDTDQMAKEFSMQFPNQVCRRNKYL